MGQTLAYSAVLFFGMPLFYGLMHFQQLNKAFVESRALKNILLYMGFTLLAAPWSELFFNAVWRFATGSPLWTYSIAPIAHGDTSLYALLIWSMYGLNIYFVYQWLGKLRNPFWKSPFGKAVLMGIEGPLAFEVVFNLLFLGLFGTYIAYYHPSDMAHLTSWQVAPVYMWCGFLSAISLQWLEKRNSWQLTGTIWALALFSLASMACLLS